MVDAHLTLRANFPNLLTVIAPRHPERGESVAELARAAGLAARLRSRGELPDATTEIYIADTVGELGLIYRLAPIVFIGGSLIKHGGQNPIEPAKLGATILHGPHVANFAEIYAALDEAHGAELIVDATKLTAGLAAMMAQPDVRAGVADAAYRTVTALGGALERTLASLDPYLMQLRLQRADDA
jgi:3-deoxy-D-manno-octulosonic-acid transferase